MSVDSFLRPRGKAVEAIRVQECACVCDRNPIVPVDVVSLAGAQASCHFGEILGLCWSPDGRQLVTCGRDCAMRVWNCYC